LICHPNNISRSTINEDHHYISPHFSPEFSHFLPLRSKYSLQHPVLDRPQSTFFHQCEKPICTSTQNIKMNAKRRVNSNSDSNLLFSSNVEYLKYFFMSRGTPSYENVDRPKRVDSKECNANTVIPRLTKIFLAVFRTRLTNMDSANECFSGCAR